MGEKRMPGPHLHSQPRSTPPYSCQHIDSGDAWYMPISMHFDSFNPRHVPTLQFKAKWVLEGCPPPTSGILSPLPCPPFSYQHSGPGDAWNMPIPIYFDSFNPKRVPTLQFKAIWVLKGCPAPPPFSAPLPRPLTPIGIVTLGMLDICLFRCISALSTLNVCQHFNSN